MSPKESPGWKKLNSKVVYECPYYWATEDDVIQPNGNPGKYYPIHTNGSVFVVAEDNDGKIIMVGQTRYTGNNFYSWEVVAGGIRKDSTPLENAQRELKEETGLVAKEWIELGRAKAFNGLSTEIEHFFLAKDFEQKNNKLDDSEDISVTRKSVKEIEQMIYNNEIMDGQSIAAFYKYRLYIEKEQ